MIDWSITAVALATLTYFAISAIALTLLKVLAHPEVLVDSKSPEPMRPINLEINPTNTCNQSCTWCTYGYLHDRREKLTLDLVVSLLRDAKELGVKGVVWTGGGEPTVCKWLPEGMDKAAQLSLFQGMNSNGSLLDDRYNSILSSEFTYVRFSVDAASPEVYSRTHRTTPDQFQRVIDNIAGLLQVRDQENSNLTVGFSFLVDRSNVDDLRAAAALSKSIGVDYFQIKPIVHYVESNNQFCEESELWRKMEDQLPGVFELRDNRFAVHFLGHKFSDIKMQEQYFGRTYDVCRGNELLATVGADGSVDVCCAYKGNKDWSFGNLHDNRFKEIWESERRRKVLAKIEVSKCPPLCKAHEINKVIHYVNNFDAHKEFI